MKNKKISLGVFLLMSTGLTSFHAQQTALTAGGDATGSGGSVAFSIGQVFYNPIQSTNGSVEQGIQQSYSITTAKIEEAGKNISLAIFPNPTADYLSLEVAEFNGKKLSYTLTDFYGKQIRNEEIKGGMTQVDLNACATGIYFIHVNESNKNIRTFKVVKNN